MTNNTNNDVKDSVDNDVKKEKGNIKKSVTFKDEVVVQAGAFVEVLIRKCVGS